LSSHKQLWLLVGGNGAGKTTFYQTRLKPLGLPFVNADIIAKELFPENAESRSYEAAKIAEGMRNQLLLEGQSFCFETVFSHPSKIDFVAKAKALGYEVILVFLHLDTSDLNNARVSHRVALGGHTVPPSKVEARIPRVLRYVKTAITLCDQVYILDNSRADDPFRRVASVSNGDVHIYDLSPASWLVNLLKD